MSSPYLSAILMHINRTFLQCWSMGLLDTRLVSMLNQNAIDASNPMRKRIDKVSGGGGRLIIGRRLTGETKTQYIVCREVPRCRESFVLRCHISRRNYGVAVSTQFSLTYLVRSQEGLCYHILRVKNLGIRREDSSLPRLTRQEVARSKGKLWF